MAQIYVTNIISSYTTGVVNSHKLIIVEMAEMSTGPVKETSGVGINKYGLAYNSCIILESSLILQDTEAAQAKDYLI